MTYNYFHAKYFYLNSVTYSLINFKVKILNKLIQFDQFFGRKIYSCLYFLLVIQTSIPVIEKGRCDSCAICPPKSRSHRSHPRASHKSRVFLLTGWLNNTCNRIILNRLSGTRKVHDACHVGRVMRQHFDELFRSINLSLKSHTRNGCCACICRCRINDAM